VGRRSGRQLAQGREECRGCVGIVHGIQSDSGGELRRLRPEADLEHVLLAHRHQGVEFGSGIFLPVCAGCQHDRTWLVNVPLTLLSFVRHDTAAMSTPAVPDHIEPDIGGSAEIRFERQSFFLFVYATENPVYRQRPGPEFHGDAGVLETARSELQTGVKTGAIEPAGVNDTTLALTCVLDPAKRFGSSAAVVSGEEQIPSRQNDECTDHVDDKQASHRRTSLPL
jgi:hypothetical protein